MPHDRRGPRRAARPAEGGAAPAGPAISFRPEDSSFVEGASDRAHAALLLARRMDRASLRPIRKLVAGASAADKPVYQLTVDILTGKQPASQPAPRPAD